MFAIFFDLTSFFDLQEWVPTGDLKKKKKKRILDCMKLKYYKEVLDFSNIEYHIIFLITQILGQQCHASDSLETRVH